MLEFRQMSESFSFFIRKASLRRFFQRCQRLSLVILGKFGNFF